MKVYPLKEFSAMYGENVEPKRRVEFLARTAAQISLIEQGVIREPEEDEIAQLRDWAEREVYGALN